jgi:hypothetical protein
MLISINSVSSVMLRPKKLEIGNIDKTVKSHEKNPNKVPWQGAKSIEG